MGIATQNMIQTRWLGLDTRSSDSDVEPLRWTQLRNFNPFARPGLLIPDKGFVKAFSEALSECEFVTQFEDRGGRIVTLANDDFDLRYWVDNASSKRAGTYSKGDTNAVVFNNEVRFSRYGLGFFAGPQWFARVNYKRFETAEDVFYQSIDEYVYYQKGLFSPELAAVTPAGNLLKVDYSEVGDGAFTDQEVYYKFSYIFDGYQEKGFTKDSYTVIGTTVDIRLTLSVRTDIISRITGINVYRSTDDANYYFLAFIPLNGAYLKPDLTYEYWDDGSAPVMSIFFDDTGAPLSELLENRLDYIFTDNTSPGYIYGAIFQDRMYVAYVRTTEDATPAQLQREKQMWLYSSSRQYDVIPDTNFGVLPDEITGMTAYRNAVIIFTEKEMFFVDQNRILDSKGIGCLSHRSIATFDRFVFWVSRSGVYSFDGLQVRNLSRERLHAPDFESLTMGQLQDTVGLFDTINHEYYVIFSTESNVWVYNMEFGEWRKRDMNLVFAAPGVNFDLLATDGTYIQRLLQGYTYDGVAYNCFAATGTFEIAAPSRIELVRFILRHKNSEGGISVKFVSESQLQRTLNFAAARVRTISSASLMGIDENTPSFFGNDLKMQISLSSPVAGDSIDSLNLQFRIADIF